MAARGRSGRHKPRKESACVAVVVGRACGFHDLPVQFLNTEAPMAAWPGIDTNRRLAHPVKARSPMSRRRAARPPRPPPPATKATVARSWLWAKASTPMWATLPGMATDVRELAPKARAPMRVTPSGSVMCARRGQPANAESPMSRKLAGRDTNTCGGRGGAGRHGISTARTWMVGVDVRARVRCGSEVQ